MHCQQEEKMTAHCWWCDTPERLGRLYKEKGLVNIHESCFTEIMNNIDILSGIEKRLNKEVAKDKDLGEEITNFIKSMKAIDERFKKINERIRSLR